MKRLTLLVLALALAACQRGPVSTAVPSVPVIGGDLNCAASDHGFEDGGAGWGFCYPKTWRYNERVGGGANPTHLDIALDITDVPCETPSPVPGEDTPRPVCSPNPNAGLFGFMLISTYERAGAPDLATWMQTNLSPVPAGTAILWGNATEANLLSDGRRIAMTPTHVVIMDLRSGQGQLDLEGAMSARLDTWKFLA